MTPVSSSGRLLKSSRFCSGNLNDNLAAVQVAHSFAITGGLEVFPLVEVKPGVDRVGQRELRIRRAARSVE